MSCSLYNHRIHSTRGGPLFRESGQLPSGRSAILAGSRLVRGEPGCVPKGDAVVVDADPGGRRRRVVPVDHSVDDRLPHGRPRGRGRSPPEGEITRPGEPFTRVLRVVTLEDGETIHNAFFDRSFGRGSP